MLIQIIIRVLTLLITERQIHPIHKISQKKCPYVNKNKFIHKDDLKGKCVGCDVDSITKNYPYVMKDFN